MDLVSHFGEDTIFRIFGGPVLVSAFLFLDPEYDNDDIEKEFYKVAKFNKEEGIFCFGGCLIVFRIV
jgi:hypothetical protein